MASSYSGAGSEEDGNSGKSDLSRQRYATPSFKTPSNKPDTSVMPSNQTQPPSFIFTSGPLTEANNGLSPQPAPFRFGQAGDSTAWLNTPPVGRPPLPRGIGSSLRVNKFTFRSLYNASPTPSPQPSPRPSPQTLPAQPLIQPQTDFGLSSLTLSNDPGAGDKSATSEATKGRVVAKVSSELLPLTEKPTTRDSKSIKLPALHDQPHEPKPYDVSHEEAPPHPLFTFLFQSAIANGVAIARDMEGVIRAIGSSVGFDSDLKRLLSDAERLSAFVCSNNRIVAVLGDSGQGGHRLRLIGILADRA